MGDDTQEQFDFGYGFPTKAGCWLKGVADGKRIGPEPGEEVIAEVSGHTAESGIVPDRDGGAYQLQPVYRSGGLLV